MKKNACFAVAAVAIVALGAAGCRERAATPRGYQGVIEFEERVVSFELPGRVEAVRVRRGDAVGRGEVLTEQDATLERLSREVRAGDVEVARADQRVVSAGARGDAVAAAEAQVRAAREAEGLLRRSAERVRRLAQAEVVAEAERDRVDSEMERAVAERQAAEARLRDLRRGARHEEIERAQARTAAASRAVALEEERVARHTLRAPAAGVVLDVHVEAGELAGAGAPAVTLADVGHPYADVFVAQGQLGGIKVGSKATVRVDAAAEPAAGVVEWISPKTEFTPRFLFSERERPNLVVRVRVRIDDEAGRLHAGVPAFVEIAR